MEKTSTPKKAVVIGGGITGLTACYRLIAESEKRGIPLDVKLLEASDRVGGVIGTLRQNGFTIEHGPDAFITTKPWAKALCEELGLEDEFLGTNPKERRSFVVHKGKLRATPEGFYMMAPGSLRPFVTTPIFSWGGKLRMALDLVIPRRRSDEDESVEHFVTRRLGNEAFTRMAQPMIGGVYTGDAKHLSLRATFPQFLEMEQKHGSVIRALLARKKQANQGGSGTSGPRYSLFLSFKSGMQTLIDALVERIPSDCIQLGAEVRRVVPHTQQEGWRIHFENREDIDADLICLALPAWRTASLIESVNPTLSKHLASIPYTSSAMIALAFQRNCIGHPLNGMGFVVPSAEKRSLIGCTFSSVKFEGRTPSNTDSVLLRASVGGALQEERLEQSESEIIESVLKDLSDLLEIRGEPTFTFVSRHKGAMAQYHIGHLDLISKIETQVHKMPKLVLAGNAYGGIGIPDCVHGGDKAARYLLESLEL